MSGNIGTTGSGDDTSTGEVRILNVTGRSIFYRFQWGNSAWQPVTVATGTAEVHSFPYGPHGEAPPTPRIQFDSLYGAKDGTPVVFVAPRTPGEPVPPGRPTASDIEVTLDLEYNTLGMAAGPPPGEQPKTYMFAFSASAWPEFTKLNLNAAN